MSRMVRYALSMATPGGSLCSAEGRTLQAHRRYQAPIVSARMASHSRNKRSTGSCMCLRPATCVFQGSVLISTQPNRDTGAATLHLYHIEIVFLLASLSILLSFSLLTPPFVTFFF